MNCIKPYHPKIGATGVRIKHPSQFGGTQQVAKRSDTLRWYTLTYTLYIFDFLGQVLMVWVVTEQGGNVCRWRQYQTFAEVGNTAAFGHLGLWPPVSSCACANVCSFHSSANLSVVLQL